jgi:hypothetical protein
MDACFFYISGGDYIKKGLANSGTASYAVILFKLGFESLEDFVICACAAS